MHKKGEEWLLVERGRGRTNEIRELERWVGRWGDVWEEKGGGEVKTQWWVSLSHTRFFSFTHTHLAGEMT